LQRALLDLSRKGILLAICSKNNPDEAMAVLERHPGMLLRPGDFAAIRINWNDKAANLRELARELNLGLEALAFLDDSPAEREWIRAQLPQVTVIDLPSDPLEYASTLRRCPVFECLALSAEDRRRAGYYAGERRRAQALEGAGSLEDFYRSLGMQLTEAPVSPATLGRAAQLIQKTNQFNLTTRRHTEARIAALAGDPLWRVHVFGLNDRLGDSGIIGVTIVRREASDCEIDTLLVSCRVIGRTVESAMLAQVAARARADGAQKLIGQFIPTPRNLPARDFFQSHGGRLTAQTEEGATRWEFDLGQGTLAPPPWIECRFESPGQGS